jgi:hypothetical protein
MIKKIQIENLYSDSFIDEIKDSTKNLKEDRSYNVIIEYYNEKILSPGQELENCEVSKDQLLLKKKIRNFYESKNINIKKLYILGSKDYTLMEEASFAVEEADKKEETKDIIWPCKEIFFYDGGKRILDDMLYNDEIDIVEYENQIKTLKYEFGLLDEFEDELYLN